MPFLVHFILYSTEAFKSLLFNFDPLSARDGLSAQNDQNRIFETSFVTYVNLQSEVKHVIDIT